jgi:hypothetical protein
VSHKYDQGAWRLLALLMPVGWIFALIDYFQTGCSSMGAYGGELCGKYGLPGLGLLFVFCMAFPVVYFVKVRPNQRDASDQDRPDPTHDIGGIDL